MKKNIILTIVFTVIAVTAITGIVMRFRERPVRPPGMGMRMMGPGMDEGGPMMEGNFIGKHFCKPGFMKNELNLSEEQIRKIDELNRHYAEESRKSIDALEPERKRMRELLSKPDPDLKEIRDLLMKNSGIHTELRILRIKQGIEINRILTPEQLKLLKDRRNEMFRKRGRNFWRED